MVQSVVNLQGLQLGIQPLLQEQGQFIRLVNVESDPIGAKKKRPGYTTFLTNTTNAPVNSLFEFRKDDGTSFYLYKNSGSVIEYSERGTGAWTVAGNGTLTSNNPMGWGTLNNTLIVGNGVDATKHTTDGVNFVDTSLAPIASRFVDYQSSIYAIGTSSFLFKSTTNDATNWSTSGTSDSTSLVIPGGGKLLDVMKVADKVVTTKNSGAMHRWDGYALVDTAISMGPTSPQSVVNIEDFRLYLNRLGYFGYNGQVPKQISASIRPQIYNDNDNAIAGSIFDTAPGGVYRYQAMWSVGTVTDSFTEETVSNCLQVYDFQLDQFSNHSFGTMPTAFVKYKDINGVERTVFGDATGQCYTYGGTATSDNGLPIESIVEFIYHDNAPHLEKKFNYLWLFFNPGCQARVQVAVGNTYVKGKKQWRDLGDTSSGVVEFKFSGDRGRLLFIKITESSTTSRFSFYGCAVDYDPIKRT